jgi:hypothetical protein
MAFRDKPGRRREALRDELAAQVQATLAVLALLGGAVQAHFVGADEMDDLVPSGREQLGDQLAMAAPPQGLGAQEARHGLGERGGEGALPRLAAHSSGVAAEGRRGDASEALLAGFPAPSAPELDGMPVADPSRLERRCQRLLAELWVSARHREAPNIHERLDTGPSQTLDELGGRPRPMADREGAHERQA